MDAPAHLQSYLDVVAAAVMENDWDAYSRHVCLPFHLVTHTANITVSTQTDLRKGFDDFRNTLKSQHITDYIRLVETASQLDPDLITGQYMTHILAGSQRVIAPFRSSITLRLIGNQWRAASITNALANSRWPISIPRLADLPEQTLPPVLPRKD